jgi:nitroimidazol reductase NimA-like FMN-containing flavoprotein (pyridoxamine 5'-phosphate oxidase superfamily)
MKNTLDLIEKIQSECPKIQGAKPDVTIRSGNYDGLIIEATWYCEETYEFYYKFTRAEINSDDTALIGRFIHVCTAAMKQKIE